MSKHLKEMLEDLKEGEHVDIEVLELAIERYKNRAVRLALRDYKAQHFITE